MSLPCASQPLHIKNFENNSDPPIVKHSIKNSKDKQNSVAKLSNGKLNFSRLLKIKSAFDFEFKTVSVLA